MFGRAKHVVAQRAAGATCTARRFFRRLLRRPALDVAIHLTDASKHANWSDGDDEDDEGEGEQSGWVGGRERAAGAPKRCVCVSVCVCAGFERRGVLEIVFACWSRCLVYVNWHLLV
jgi:hypothetical protein